MTVSSRVPLRRLGQPQSRPLCPFPALGFQAHLARKLCVFASPPQSCLFTRTALSVLYYRPLFVGISPPLASKCCQSEAPMGKDPERVNWPMCYFPTQYLHLSLRGKEGKRNSETAFTSACLGERAWHAAGPPRGSDAGITGCQTAVVQREGLTSSHP